MTPAYRSDIDGLRAIAVAAVVLFHSGVPGFSGGYVGVDVFFVISGYLITRLLTGADAASLPMPLSAFYVRRARRILPALLLTSAVSTICATALLLPWDVQRFGKYLAATAVLSSNVPAWLEQADYFDKGILYVPVTHFWSIAVEEQFYLLYPLVVLAVGRFLPGRRAAALAVLAAASFALCVWASQHRPIANFFLAPTRAWELLLGAIIASGAVGPIRNYLVNELLAAAGLAALLAVICWYVPSLPYPGVYALAPCAATALLILTGGHRPAWTHRLLSLPPLVFTGLISYSLYLWHLPILLFVAYFRIQTMGPWGSAAALALVYAVAALSWRFVELPFRNRGFLKSSGVFVRWALAADVLMLLVGIALWNSNGFPGRYPAELADMDRDWAAVSDRMSKCGNVPLESIAAGDLCSFGPAAPSARVALVWGDSHAMVLMPAYEELAKSLDVRVYVAILHSCRPLVDVANMAVDRRRRANCERFNTAVTQAVRRLRPGIVILNARWIDEDKDLVPHGNVPAAPGKTNFMRGVEQTLISIGSDKRTVCAVLDDPTYPYSIPYAVGMARRRGIPEDFLTVTRADALGQFRGPENDFSMLRQRGALQTIDLKDALCSGERCLYEAKGSLLYSDRDHLSVAGAHFVSSAIAGCFREVPSRDSR
jgi:peptidoglycan/LPS O-acetylase OafA/YrhL